MWRGDSCQPDPSHPSAIAASTPASGETNLREIRDDCDFYLPLLVVASRPLDAAPE